jgi:hypothetical protein
MANQEHPDILVTGVDEWTIDVALYYTFDNDHVYFLSIEKTKLPEL